MSKITIELDVTDDLCNSLLTSCFEGGSADWLACETIHRNTDNDVTRIVGCCDRENESTTWGDADAETMRRGIRKILEGSVQINKSTPASLLRAIADGDPGVCDALDADCVLQVGLLGEITYG